MIDITIPLQEDELTYQSPDGEYAIRYKLIDNQILISESEGYMEYESARMGFILFEKIIANLREAGPFQPVYYIADAKKLTGIDWKSRQYLVTQLSRLFEQEIMYSGALIGSDFLTRTLANLILVFSKKATVAFFNTQEEALLQLRQQKQNPAPQPAIAFTPTPIYRLE